MTGDLRRLPIRLLQKSSILRFLCIPLLLVAFMAIIGGISLLFRERPVLDSINPSIGEPGGVIVLHGRHFGKAQGDNWIEIAGNRISGNAVIEWTDTMIMMRLPATVDDGIVYVHGKTAKSNPQIFVNKDGLPVAAKVKADVGQPTIASFDNDNAETGKTLVIKGQNFGITRNNSEVLFTWQLDSAIPQASVGGATTLIACSDHDFDYELWSDQEIHVRVPDGASSGNVYVRTDRGTSNPLAVKLVNRPGTRKYSDQRTCTVSLGVTISGVSASDGNMLFIRVPMPVTTASQRNVSISASNPKPYMENYQGTILHQMENLKSGKTESISHSFILANYAVATTINPAQVKPYSDTGSAFYTTYTSPDRIVPSADQDIILKATEIVGQEKNAYKKAKLIYSWLVANIKGEKVENLDRPVREALAKQSGDDYDMAILFCALARATGIPAVPVAGILVDGQQNSRIHWWAEFYVESFGWVPADPGLGAGIPFPVANSGDWYFGNLDANHIAFSRGWADQKPMAPKSRVVYKPRSFAFQPVWEESGGNIKGYTSYWDDPKVTGVYTNGQ
jgi:hypothetical protein